MIAYLKRLTIRNLVSPYGLALASFAVFLLAWIAPPSFYMEYAGEPDILYLNPIVLLFYSCCVLVFLAGVRTFTFLRPSASLEEQTVSTAAPLTFLLLPLAVSTLLCVASLVAMNAKVSNLAGLFLARQGALIKLAGASGQVEIGSWGYVITFHTGVLWWAYSRFGHLHIAGIARPIFKVFFALALGVGLATALIKVDRTNLIPIIVGIFLIYLFSKLAGRDMAFTRLLTLCFVLATVVLVVFFIGSYLRGASDARLLTAGIFGYTAASYNRLAAEVTGILHYSFGGRGTYLSSFLSFNNTINRIIPFNAWMGAPTQRGVYFSEFSSIAAAGLNPGFNWPGAFGYLYADLGWWTPIYLYPVGLFNGYLWHAFRAKNVVGVILYPWAGFSILFWFGWNILFDLRMALLMSVVVMLAFYEALTLRRHFIAVPIAVPAVVPASV